MLNVKQSSDAKTMLSPAASSKSLSSGTAEAAEQAPRFLPVLKRRTRALPIVTLEEEERPGITCTDTEPEEEQGLAEGIPV